MGWDRGQESLQGTEAWSRKPREISPVGSSSINIIGIWNLQ